MTKRLMETGLTNKLTKRLMLSNLTNKIVLTKVRQDKNNPYLYIATGEKQDYTDEAIRAVFQWFINNFEMKKDNVAFEIRFPDCPYVLAMTKERKENA